jgi:hypothetical protein
MPKRNKQELELPAYDLRAQREARGLTQTQVAEILFTHQTSIARWERDGNVPRIYRKAWELHWQLEDKSHGKGKGKTKGSKPKETSKAA